MMIRLIGVILTLMLLPLQAEAASMIDSHSRFHESPEANCAVVQSVASKLYDRVKSAAASYHTTFADVIDHNGLDALNTPGSQNIDPGDFAEMQVILRGWDTAAQEMRTRYPDLLPSEEIVKQRYLEAVRLPCLDKTR